MKTEQTIEKTNLFMLSEFPYKEDDTLDDPIEELLNEFEDQDDDKDCEQEIVDRVKEFCDKSIPNPKTQSDKTQKTLLNLKENITRINYYLDDLELKILK